ncbi:MAG: hypothetical protein EZS28_036369, partial [Streblomastix strix]
MNQPMLCNLEERASEVEEDHGLCSTKQIPLFNTLYNGGCLQSQIYLTTQRLDDQNRPRVYISPYSNRRGIQAIPRLLLQPEVLPLQSYRGHKGPHHTLLRRHHLFTSRSRGIDGKEVADNQHTDELWMEDISQEVSPGTSKSSRVSGMEDGLRTGSIINDRSKIEENDSNVRIMEKDCAEQAVCEGEVPGKLHRIVKLPEIVD